LVELDELIPALSPMRQAGVLANCLETMASLTGLVKGVSLCCSPELTSLRLTPDRHCQLPTMGE